MKRRQRIISWAVVAGAIAYMVVSCMSFALERWLNCDEHQYLAPCILVRDGYIPYRDFAYAQTPLMPMVYGTLFSLLPGGFTAARVLTAGFACAAGTVLALQLHRRARTYGALPAVIAAAFYCYSLAGHPLFALGISYIHNQALALFFCALGFLILPEEYEQPIRRSAVWNVLFGGILMGLACSTRVLFVFVGPMTALWVMATTPRGARWRLGLLCACGVGIGLLPCLVRFLMNPTNFVWNMYYMHSRLPGLDARPPLVSAGGLARVWSFTREFMEKPHLVAGHLVFATAMLSMFATLVRRGKAALFGPRDYLAVGIVVSLALTHFSIPLPLSQYFATLVPFVLWVSSIFIAWGVGRLQERKGWELAVVMPLVALSLVSSSWMIRFHAQKGVFRATGVRALQTDARTLQEALGARAKILTVTQCVTIEAGYPATVKLAAGSVGLKWGTRLQPEEAVQFRLMTARQVEALFAAGEPDAGIAVDDNDELFEGIMSRHYVRSELLKTGKLYLRPDIAERLNQRTIQPAEPSSTSESATSPRER